MSRRIQLLPSLSELPECPDHFNAAVETVAENRTHPVIPPFFMGSISRI